MNRPASQSPNPERVADVGSRRPAGKHRLRFRIAADFPTQIDQDRHRIGPCHQVCALTAQFRRSCPESHGNRD